ncbi:hypothetical protein V8C42DRAFT_357812 [Trichoderma barbatum]
MARRTTLRKAIEKKGGKHASKNTESALLQMPMELIRELSNDLPPVDKIIFTQTCRPICNSVDFCPFSKDEEEFREQKFEYLARRCRDIPNQWVCEECMCHHNINVDDTPASPILVCPRGRLYRTQYNLSLNLIAREDYRLGRRHVQLALKYTRLFNEISSQHRRYLERLMASRMYSFSTLWENIPVFHAAKITPRVVNGRYLLKCIFDYRQKALPMDKRVLAGDFVCRHQQFLQEDITVDGPLLKFQRAVGDAFNRRGREVHSHCPHCCTDFSVKASLRNVRLTVWHDLGTESSALDPVWRACVYSPGLYSSDEDLVNNAPGRVRELYEGKEK